MQAHKAEPHDLAQHRGRTRYKDADSRKVKTRGSERGSSWNGLKTEMCTHLVAVDIKAVWALHALKDDGLAAHRLEGAHRGVHSSWQQRLSLLEDLQQQARLVNSSLVPKPAFNGIHQGVRASGSCV